MYIHYRFVKEGNPFVLGSKEWKAFIIAMRMKSWSLKHIFICRDFMVLEQDEKEVLEWCMRHHIEVEMVP